MSLFILAVVSLGCLIFFLRAKRTLKPWTVLILGQEDSGKTCLYFRLIKDVFPETIASGTLNMRNYKNVILKDIPYPLFKKRMLDRERTAIILIVDPTRGQEAVDFAQPILGHERVANGSIPLLVAFSKSDIAPNFSYPTEDLEGVKKINISSKTGVVGEVKNFILNLE